MSAPGAGAGRLGTNPSTADASNPRLTIRPACARSERLRGLERRPDRPLRSPLRAARSRAIRWRQNARTNPKSMGDASWPEYRKAGYGRVLKTVHYSLLGRPEDKTPRVRAPCLVVRGARDPVCRRPWAERLAKAIPHARLVELPDCAHTLVHTRLEELAATAGAFLLGRSEKARNLARLG